MIEFRSKIKWKHESIHTNDMISSDQIRIIAIVIAAIVLIGLIYYYYTHRKPTNEKFSEIGGGSYYTKTPTAQSSATYTKPYNGISPRDPAGSACTRGGSSQCAAFDPMPIEPASNEYYLPPPPTTSSSSFFSDKGNTPNSCAFPQDRLRPEDLLPKDAANTKWAQANPAGQGDINDVNLLNAGFHIGVNTQGQSLRNASHDIRSEPANPRYKVSIWNNSTIEPDLNRKPLE